MIGRALDAGVPFTWFVADEEFGQNPGLRAFLEEREISYVMAIPKTTEFTDSGDRGQTVEEAARQVHRRTGSAAPAASAAKDSGFTTGH